MSDPSPSNCSVNLGALLYASLMDSWPIPPQFHTLSEYDQKRLNRVAEKFLASKQECENTALRGKVFSATRDVNTWALFDEQGDLIEEWPTDWPETVTRKWLLSLGVHAD